MQHPLFQLLTGIEGPHPVHVVPYAVVPASGRDDHERGGQPPLPVHLLGQGDMVLVGVDALPAVLPVHLLHLRCGHAGQLLFGHQPVAAGAPEAVGVDLPLGPGVFLLALDHGFIGIGRRRVRGQLPKQQDVFRTADAHLAAVLALFAPAQAVGLIVLPNHVCDDGDHAEVLEAVAHGVLDGHGVEGLHRRHARARGVSEEHAVLDVAGVHPPRLQHSQQVGRQIVHLPEKIVVVLVHAEVHVVVGILVMIAEGDGRDDLIHRVFRHVLQLIDAIIVDCPVVVARDLHSLHSHRVPHLIKPPGIVQAVLFDDVGHVPDHLIVAGPLLHQSFANLFLRFRVDDVDDDPLGLQKPVNAVDGLYEIVEFVVDAQEDGPVTVPLEVTALPADALLRGQQPYPPVAEGDDPLLAGVVILRAVDLHGLGDCLLDGVALGLQIVPQYEMGLGVAADNLQHLGDAVVDAVPLFLRGVLQGECGVPDQLHLPVFVASRRGVVHGQPVPSDVHLRQVIAGVVVSQIGRLFDEQGP